MAYLCRLVSKVEKYNNTTPHNLEKTHLIALISAKIFHCLMLKNRQGMVILFQNFIIWGALQIQ